MHQCTTLVWPLETQLTGQTRLAHKHSIRPERRNTEQQERGQEPGIKQGHLICTSRITPSHTEHSLSVADSTELCSLSPPTHLHKRCPVVWSKENLNRFHCQGKNFYHQHFYCFIIFDFSTLSKKCV